MREMPTKVDDRFKSWWANPTMDIDEILKPHFHHLYFDYVNGERVEYADRFVYNVTEKFAKYLLHNLKHDLPKDEDFAQRLFSFSNDLYLKGNIAFSKNPIVINKRANTIEDGVLRLFGLAVSRCRGTYYEIKTVDIDRNKV